MTKRLLRGAGYAAFSFFALLLGLYLTFPGQAVGQRMAHELRHRTGGQITATIGDVSLYRLTGIEAEKVRLMVNMTEPPTPVTLDAVRARVQILPLLMLNLSFFTELEMRGGTVAALINPDDDGALAVEAEIEDFNVAKPPILPGLAGLPINGVISGEGQVRWSQDPRKSSGEGKLSLKQVAVGPGEPYQGFSLPVPVGLGDLDFDFEIKGGQLKLGKFSQRSGEVKTDLEIHNATGNANLRRTMATTSYEACLALKFNQEFLGRNPKFETVMTLAAVPAPVGPGFRRDGGGFLHAAVTGTLGSRPKPRRRLCSQDVKAKGKKEKPNKPRNPPKRPK